MSSPDWEMDAIGTQCKEKLVGKVRTPLSSGFIAQLGPKAIGCLALRLPAVLHRKRRRHVPLAFLPNTRRNDRKFGDPDHNARITQT